MNPAFNTLVIGLFMANLAGCATTYDTSAYPGTMRAALVTKVNQANAAMRRVLWKPMPAEKAPALPSSPPDPAVKPKTTPNAEFRTYPLPAAESAGATPPPNGSGGPKEVPPATQ